MVVRALATSVIAVVLTLSATVCLSKPPFDPDRKALYSQKELWKGWDADRETPGFDDIVYAEYRELKYFPDATTSRLRSRHDEGIASALRAYAHDIQRSIVGVMGSGNATLRCSVVYEKTVRVAWLLAHDGGFLIATGGGPGQMEAGNLGAYLANYGPDNIDQALKLLRTNIDRDPVTRKLRWSDKQECKYLDDKMQDDKFAYTAASKAVVAKFANGHESLGVPTWFYGNEAPNVFATKVAKFFSNGIREDALVTAAVGGLIIAPGSAGTRQEIFMDMTKNVYSSYCYRSPVVFLGRDYWGPIPTELKDGRIVEREDGGVYALVHKLAPDLREWMSVTDTDTDVLAFLKGHEPKLGPPPLPDGCDKMP
jgi:predicted Rossmann-fold nucleotide-binding protein